MAASARRRWPGLVERLNQSDFVRAVADWAGGIPSGARRVLAIAAPPGGGKSTLAEQLVSRLPNGAAAILPMDGFHYDDEVLIPRGHRPRKGAPHTFDVGGFAALLRRLRDNAEDEIAVPRFDRDLEISRGAARIVPRDVRLIVAEGNYLLLDQEPWASLRPLYDRAAFLDVPEAEVTRRLRARWEGYGMDEAGIRAKLEENDLPNARLVIEQSVAPDWVVGTD